MTLLSSLLIMLMTTATTRRTREFRFVPYGSSFQDNPENRPTISCDGRVSGAISLELSHWTGNQTPDSLYADTSTEMALKFAKQDNPIYENTLILNNHYDTDGVLSVWACLHPSEALNYATLLKEGAEAGDFGEWSSDNGVKLDCAIESFLVNNEEKAYQNVLKALPDLLQDLQETGGNAHAALWKKGFQAALDDWEAIQSETASLKRGPGKMVLVQEPDDHHLSPFALHRGLVTSGLSQGTTRILRCLQESNKFQYRYEMPGYGWVKKLVDRSPIPAADERKLIEQLQGGCWVPSGSLTGICHTTSAIETPPNNVATILYELDDGCK